MRAFDASSIVYAWDNYPPEQFPALWRWISGEIDSQRLVICEVAYEEVRRKFVEPFNWLKEQDINVVPMTAGALGIAAAIKSELGIVGDKFHGKGVGENDIFIIASACEEGHELISNEERQPQVVRAGRNMKIPAVCGLELVSVPCKSFIELLKESGKVFGK